MPVQTRTIGHYALVRELGRGGMGVVFRACHNTTGAIVALKTLIAISGNKISSLRREILALTHLNHPGIVKIYDHGLHDSIPWYTMEYLEGTTLRFSCQSSGTISEAKWWTQSLAGDRSLDGNSRHSLSPTKDQPRKRKNSSHKKQAPDDVMRILTIVHRVCEAVAFMHGEGIIHRDLKPENILIRPDGNPVIMDFGLAAYGIGKSNREILDVIRPGMGTLHYMAPELYLSDKADCRTDLYSIGCILYEMLTDRLPFDGIDPATILHNQLTQSVTPPSQLVSGLPSCIDVLINSLLESDPARRIGYAQDVCDILETAGVRPDHNRTRSPRHYLHRPRFSGRKQLFTQLNQCLARASVGKGCMMLLSGESGIGKTRLALEIGGLALRNAFFVVMGECSILRSTSASTYRPRSEIFQGFQKPFETIMDLCLENGEAYRDKILGDELIFLAYFSHAIFDSLSASVRSELPPLAYSDTPFRLFRSVTTVLKRLSLEKPLLIIIDDLQWADELTIGMIDYLATHSIYQSHRIAFLGFYRADETTDSLLRLIDKPAVESTSLYRLDRQEIVGIINDMLASDSAFPSFIDQLANLADGNPYYIAEYLNACLDSGMLKKRYGIWSFHTDQATNEPDLPSIPTSLKQLTAHRLTLLTSQQRHLVDLSSILGQDINPKMLQRIARYSDEIFVTLLRDLKNRHLFEELHDGSIRFFHDKIREAALDQLSADAGRAYHKTAVEVIEGEFEDYCNQHPLEIGHHWEMAGEYTKAYPWLHKAIEAAISRFAMGEAEAIILKILAFTPSIHVESIRARFRLGRAVYEYRGEHHRAVDLFSKARDDAKALGNLEFLAGLEVGICINSIYCGNYTAAIESGEAAIALFEQLGNKEQIASVYGHFAAIAHRKGEFEEALRLNNLALQIYQLIDNKEMQSWVLGNIARIQFSLAQDDNCLNTLNDSLLLAREAKNNLYAGNTLGCMGIIHTYRFNFVQAERCLREAVSIHQQDGNRRMEGQELSNLADLMLAQGNLTGARDILNEAEIIHKEYGNPIASSKNDVAFGRYHYSRCEFSEARHRLNRALPQFRALEIHSYVGLTLNWLSSVELASGHIDRFCEYQDECRQIFEKVQDYRSFALCNIETARYRILLHDFDGAEKLIRNELERTKSRHLESEYILLLIALARTLIHLGRWDEVEPLLVEAIQKAGRFHLTSIEAEARLEQVHFARLRGMPKRSISASLRTIRQHIDRTGDRLLEVRLCTESAFFNHLLGKSGRPHVQQILEILDVSEIGIQSPLRLLISNVIRAVDAFEAGDTLQAGQCPNDLPCQPH